MSNSPLIRTLVISAVVFSCVFGLVILLFNLPAVIKNITYSTTHTEEKDNQQLTDQYRALYGYASHPELSITSLYGTGTADEQIELSVPKLDVKAPVLLVPSGTDADILTALKKGVVIFPGSVLPGQTGTTVIIGHSSTLPPWTKYSAVFAKLGALAQNDLIYLTVQGRTYTYRVTTVRHGSVQSILNSGMTGDLILSTCWPAGTDINRVAVAAVRVLTSN
jgi:LPXTG-site transpeptidase (sortase) family protein